MFTRLSLSLFLIGIGIGSPWLVRDWLGSRPEGKRTNSFYSSFTSFPEKIKNRNRVAPPVTEAVRELTESGLEREPYPLASQSRRIMQGFLHPSSGEGSGEKIPFFGKNSVPSTPRTQAITKDAATRMKSELGALSLKSGDPVFLRLFKEECELEVWLRAKGAPHYTLFKVFRINDCAGGPGPKLREGDGQVPEGFYLGTAANFRPETRHHLGFDLGYPNEYDRYHGRTGGGLMIHGGASAAGAVALSREGIEEIYALIEAAVEAGQGVVPFNLFPFRMTDPRMDQAWKTQPQCLDFWVNLKEGYDFFENVRQPPVVEVSAGKYFFRLEGHEN